jgi:phage FluMu gp28-like protein
VTSTALSTTSLTGLPDVFLTYQQQLWRAIDEHQLVVVEKSRRTGFSWAMGAISAATASAERISGGQDVLYMGYEKEMTREFIDYVGSFAKQFQMLAGDVEEGVFSDPDHPERDIQVFRIKFASGFETVALPSVPRALRGKQGLVILDEAAFMDDLEEVLKAALALLIWGGKVVVISTHNGETNPFNTLITDIRAGRRRGKVLRLTFDEALEQGLYQRICLTRGLPWSPAAQDNWVAEIRAIYKDNADEELDVIPNPSTGAYLPGPLLDARVDKSVSVLRWTSPPGFALWAEHLRVATVLDWCNEELAPLLACLSPSEAHALGEDFGRIRDLTVLWLLAICRDLVRRTRIVVELRNVPYEQQRQILFFILDRTPRFRAGVLDATGNGGYLAEVAMQKYGERIQALMLNEPWYRENMPPFKAALEDSMMTLPADIEVQDDLRMLRLVRGVARIPERRLSDDKQPRHGDAAIAACLAYAASRMEPEEYEYRAAPVKAADDFAGLSSSAGRRWSDRSRAAEEDRRTPGRSILPAFRGGAFGR